MQSSNAYRGNHDSPIRHYRNIRNRRRLGICGGTNRNQKTPRLWRVDPKTVAIVLPSKIERRRSSNGGTATRKGYALRVDQRRLGKHSSSGVRLPSRLSLTTELLHARIGVRTRSEEHSGTRVDDPASERVERRTNDTNANGDRPLRETSGDRGRQTQNRGGTRTTDPHMNTTPSPLGGARQQGERNHQ